MRNIKPTFLLYFLPVIWIWSCAPSRIVRPLEKGSYSVSGNLGGPMIRFSGAAIPVPLTSVSVAKGLTEKTTGFAALHLTSLAFGVLQTEAGICRNLYTNETNQFGVSVNPVLNLAIDRWEKKGKIWPEADINVYKQLGTKHLVYGGLTNWFEPSGKRPHGETQTNRLFVNPHLGYGYSTSKWTYTLECKWLAPGIKNIPNVVDYIGVNQKGAIGVYFNFSRVWSH